MWSAYYPANRALHCLSQHVSAFISTPKRGTGWRERKEDRELIKFTAAAVSIGLILVTGQDSFPQQTAGWGSEHQFKRFRGLLFRTTPWEQHSRPRSRLAAGSRPGQPWREEGLWHRRLSASIAEWQNRYINLCMKNKEACWLLIFPDILVMLNMAGLP